MFSFIKKWWQERQAAKPKEIDPWPTTKKEAKRLIRPRSMDSNLGRELWRMRANYRGCLKNLAAMRSGSIRAIKSKRQIRRFEGHCDRTRAELMKLEIAFARETRYHQVKG
jgi:hypothetical protein